MACFGFDFDMFWYVLFNSEGFEKKKKEIMPVCRNICLFCMTLGEALPFASQDLWISPNEKSYILTLHESDIPNFSGGCMVWTEWDPFQEKQLEK